MINMKVGKEYHLFVSDDWDVKNRICLNLSVLPFTSHTCYYL